MENIEQEIQEKIEEKIETPKEKNYSGGVKIFFVLALVFVATGFYKMLAYNDGGSYGRDAVNCYVGGDAYNFIINSNYTTAFFVLALACVVVACTLLILNQMIQNKNTIVSN